MKFPFKNKRISQKYSWAVIAAAMLIGASICFCLWTVFEKSSDKNWEIVDIGKKIEIEEWKTFTSKELGFSFKYPAMWGKAEEEFSPASTGENYIISFSNIDLWGKREINYFYATGKSKDFIRGYGEIGPYDYKGEPDNPNTIINTKLLASKSVIPNFVNIDFNLPNKRISGVRLFITILSDNDIEKFNGKCPCIPREERQEKRQGICIYEDEAKCLSMYIQNGRYAPELFSEMYKNRYVGPSISVEEYLKELEKESLDSVSQKGIYIFREILASSKIL